MNVVIAPLRETCTLSGGLRPRPPLRPRAQSSLGHVLLPADPGGEVTHARQRRQNWSNTSTHSTE
eukprot:3329350-Pyramimonas_sp.AAC.1